MTKVMYQTVSLLDQPMILAASDQGLCFVGTPGAGVDELADFQLTADLVHQETPILTQATAELREYLAGGRHHFDVPLDPITGTALQRQVWHALSQLNYGETISYSTLAARVEHPTAVRAVATAVAKNPLMIVVPCHRILRKDGSIGQFRGGVSLKRQLLTLESR